MSLALLTTTLFADAAPEIPTDPMPIQEAAPANSSSVQPAPQTPVEEGYVVETTCENEYGSSVLNEFKMGYFRFADKKLRRRYNDGVLDLQLTSSFNFWKRLYAYVGIEYVGSNGRNVPKSHKEIKIRMVPISLGVQYMKPITDDLKYYVTLGGRYFFVHQWTHSRSLTHNGLGGFGNTGFIYYLNHHVVVDIFGEYSYKKMKFHDMGGNLRVGGLTLGAGVGYFW